MLLEVLDNNFTFTFYNRSIHSIIKTNSTYTIESAGEQKVALEV